MATTKELDPKLERAIQDSLKAYSSGNKRFFDYIREDVRVYGLNSSQPILGRKAFESAFGPAFKTKRKVAVVHRDVQLSGKQAVLAQTLQITADGISSHVRQTVIWAQDVDGGWKMNHIHNALVGQPVVAGVPPKTINAIRVINERIATVAATVGVAQ